MCFTKLTKLYYSKFSGECQVLFCCIFTTRCFATVPLQPKTELLTLSHVTVVWSGYSSTYDILQAPQNGDYEVDRMHPTL